MEPKEEKAREEKLRISKWKINYFARSLKKLDQRNNFFQSLRSRKWQCIFQMMMSLKHQRDGTIILKNDIIWKLK